RHGAHLLWRNPGTTAIAVISLALGIGANLAVFNLINLTLLRELPVSEPSRLVYFYKGTSEAGTGGFAGADYLDFRQRTDVFEGVAAYSTGVALLVSNDTSERIPVGIVSRNYFQVLGCPLSVGRAFQPDDPYQVAVISQSFWRRRFASSPSAIGQTLRINGEVFTVIGVAGNDFKGAGAGEVTEVWGPLEAHNTLLPWAMEATPEHVDQLRLMGRNTEWLDVIGRLRPGVSWESAHSAVKSMSKMLLTDSRRKDGHWVVGVTPAGHGAMGPSERQAVHLEMFAYLTVSLLVLISACANVSSLMLARTWVRRREVAVRLALGAPRMRLFRQFLTESVLLGLAGGVAALAFAASFPILLGWLGVAGPLTDENYRFSIDFSLLGFALAVSVAAGALFGFAPAIQGVRQKFSICLRQGQHAHRSRSWLRETLVVAQVCISLVLLIAAGLLTRSLGNWFALNPEFARKNLLMVSFELTPREAERFYGPLLERVQKLPGVSSASLAHCLPLDLFRMQWGQSRIENQTVNLTGNSVGPGYFETMGIPILAGRGFGETDTKESKRVAVINETMARTYWPGQDPIGRKLEAGHELRTVVGVVADSRHYDMRALLAGTGSFMYIPVSQYPSPRLHLILQPAGPTGFVLDRVRQEVRQLNPKVIPVSVKTAREHLQGMFAKQRTAALVTAVLALLALALALSGVYGIVSNSVTARTQEIGIRMALGAPRTSVLNLVLKRVLALAVIGVALGSLLGLAVSGTILNLLFGVTGHDPLTFAAAAAFVVVIALAAASIPARRATRVDPLIALRYE
ncbi:MAG: ABC transporter permease, partial [Acidobacteria bacterium]